MKKVKKISALLLALALLFLSACKDTENENRDPSNLTPPSVTEKSDTLQLLYCANDTLNPYKTKNKNNLELSLLLFESLFTVTDEFEAVKILADSVEQTEKLWTVRLISARFSDGSPVTSEDIVASYNLAKSSPIYSGLLYEIKNVTATDSSTVCFELTECDPAFCSLLTFPIIKKGSEALKDEDFVEILPIGSGRFVFDKQTASLIPNSYYREDCSVEKITLVDSPDNESVFHYAEIGATDIYFTDPVTSNVVRMGGKRTVINMNNLVYLGINHSSPLLGNLLLRQAISCLLDRAALCKEIYFENAVPANGFFHPAYKPTAGYQTLQAQSEIKIAIENLEKMGYNMLDNDGYRINGNGNSLSLSLLVNADNPFRLSAAELIKTQFAAVGIKVTVRAVAQSYFKESLTKGDFELYLGEVKITPNMDLAPLVLSGGSAAFGIKPATLPNEAPETEQDGSSYYVSVIEGYKNGEQDITEVATALINQMPIIPILYRSSLLFSSDNIVDIGSPSIYNIFYSINSFK